MASFKGTGILLWFARTKRLFPHESYKLKKLYTLYNDKNISRSCLEKKCKMLNIFNLLGTLKLNFLHFIYNIIFQA